MRHLQVNKHTCLNPYQGAVTTHQAKNRRARSQSTASGSGNGESARLAAMEKHTRVTEESHNHGAVNLWTSTVDGMETRRREAMYDSGRLESPRYVVALCALCTRSVQKRSARRGGIFNVPC